MVFKNIIILYTIFALARGRPSSNEVTDTTMPTQESRSTPSQITMDMDSEDVSEYFRCTSCLTECTSLQIPLRYYLCQLCIKNCTQRTDAFMYFFSSHRCNVEPQEHDGEKNRPNQVFGSLLFNDRTTTMPLTHPQGLNKVSNRGLPADSPNYDYFDKYVNEQHFPRSSNDGNCAKIQRENDKLRTRHNQCMTDLGNCYSDWPKEVQPSHASTEPSRLDSDFDYPSFEYPTIDYPESYPDREKSDIPEIKQPEVTNYPKVDLTTLKRIESTNPELAHFIRQHPIYLTNETGHATSTDARSQNKTANRKIIKKFKAMFITTIEYDKLSKRTWTKDPEKIANIKSIGHNQEREVEGKMSKIPVCPTRFKVASPMKVAHRSGSFNVEILQDDEYVQPFIVAECSSPDPTVSIVEHAVCDTVSVQRPAFMIVPEDRRSSFENCYDYDIGRLVCKDWINLPGACSLYA